MGRLPAGVGVGVARNQGPHQSTFALHAKRHEPIVLCRPRAHEMSRLQRPADNSRARAQCKHME